MLYKDNIYGEFDIQEPVILDIINSPAMQRLKHIDVAGYFWPYFPGSAHFRFEHSVGVYLLLKKYGASLEEQIAGLIHDISHGTFSHCLDYVFPEGSPEEQSHQDNIFESFIQRTDIPNILKRYNLDVDYILNDKNFPLKERSLPDLCADRIDYIMRDAWHYMRVSPTKSLLILDHLDIKDNQRIFQSLEYANMYAELFYTMNEKFYASIEAAVMYQTVGDYLKHARKNGYIGFDDFYTTDQKVLDKIGKKLGEDKELSLYRQRMNNKISFRNNPQDFDARVVCKSRIVDPLFFDGEEIKRISAVDSKREKIVKEGLPAKEYFLKFER